MATLENLRHIWGRVPHDFPSKPLDYTPQKVINFTDISDDDRFTAIAQKHNKIINKDGSIYTMFKISKEFIKQTAVYSNIVCIYANKEDKKANKIASAFGIPAKYQNCQLIGLYQKNNTIKLVFISKKPTIQYLLIIPKE